MEGQCIYRGSIADSHQLFRVFCIPSCISWWRASVSIVVLLLIPINCSVCSVSPAVSPGGRPVYLCVLYPQLYLLVEGQCIYVFCIPSCISWWRASVSMCSVSPAVSPGGGPVYLCVLYPQLYLLVEGQCIYRGSIAALLPYFESQGLVCPNYHNPADYGEVLKPFSIGILYLI